MPTITEEESLTLPSIEEWKQMSGSTELTGPYVVIIYNDDWHTYAEVTFQVQKATGCSLEKAERITIEVDTLGRSIAYTGTAEKCEDVARILREIRLQVETDRAM